MKNCLLEVTLIPHSHEVFNFLSLTVNVAKHNSNSVCPELSLVLSITGPSQEKHRMTICLILVNYGE